MGRGQKLFRVRAGALLEPGGVRVVAAPCAVSHRQLAGAAPEITLPLRTPVSRRHVCLRSCRLASSVAGGTGLVVWRANLDARSKPPSNSSTRGRFCGTGTRSIMPAVHQCEPWEARTVKFRAGIAVTVAVLACASTAPGAPRVVSLKPDQAVFWNGATV